MWPARKLAIALMLVPVLASMAGPVHADPRHAVDLPAIDAYVEEQMRAHRIPGVAVAVIDAGEIVALGGYGVAGASGRAMTAQTPMLMGSLSKSFTALAVMQLVEARQVELDAPVQRYLPWFSLSDADASAAITVRHLLNQTSGIPNFAGLVQCLGGGDTSIEEEAHLLREYAPAFPAGQRFQYSNANYNVLGALVEAVSGESYAAYIKRHVFEPLQMQGSFVSQAEAQAHGMAMGYRRWFGIPVPADLPYLQHALPAGYLIASAEDVAHFLVAHMNGGLYGDARVLSAEGVGMLRTPAVDAGGGTEYGMGWVIGDFAGAPAVYHHGSDPNFHATMLMRPEARQGVVVMTNVSLLEVWHVGASGVIAEGVLHLLQGEPAPAGGLGVGARYVIADIILLAFTALEVLSIALVPRWRRRLLERPPDSAVAFGRRVALPAISAAAWSITILIAFPDISNVPAWEFWTSYQPDFAYWLIAIASIALLRTAVQIGWACSAIRVAAARIGWGKAAAAGGIVVAGFGALFFLVVFASTTTANFVVGLLAVVYGLGLAAQPVRPSRQEAVD